MWLTSFLRGQKSDSQRSQRDCGSGPKRHRRLGFTPRLEALEDRTVPGDIRDGAALGDGADGLVVRQGHVGEDDAGARIEEAAAQGNGAGEAHHRGAGGPAVGDGQVADLHVGRHFRAFAQQAKTRTALVDLLKEMSEV